MWNLQNKLKVLNSIYGESEKLYTGRTVVVIFCHSLQWYCVSFLALPTSDDRAERGTWINPHIRKQPSLLPFIKHAFIDSTQPETHKNTDSGTPFAPATNPFFLSQLPLFFSLIVTVLLLTCCHLTLKYPQRQPPLHPLTLSSLPACHPTEDCDSEGALNGKDIGEEAWSVFSVYIYRRNITFLLNLCANPSLLSESANYSS